MTRYLIIGNGAAGAAAADEIREHDPHGMITLVGAEPYPMYSRPGLAYVLLHEIPVQQVITRRPEWYACRKITLVHDRAVRLDTAAHSVHFAKMPALVYDRLLIASGARAVPLPYPGAALDGVVYLDTLAGTQDLLRKLKRAKSAVVVGGGITALEMAEGFAHHGIETHFLVRRDTLWSAVFNETESQLLEQRMRQHGVQLHYNTELTEVLGDRRQRVNGVKLNSSQGLACQTVGAGIGVQVELDWLKDSPVQIERGALVNEHLETSVPDVYAAGDCAQAWDIRTQKHILDLLWPTAVAQGRAAGANLTGARETYFKGMPFNACLLFGLHVTVIGQLGGGRDAETEIVQHTLERGTSELWSTRPHSYVSAWTHSGTDSLRLVLDGNQLAGALVIGNQTLADPLRELIDGHTDITPLRPALAAGSSELPEQLWQFYQQVRNSARGLE